MGELLRVARDRAGLTADEVVKATNIPRHHIVALEADDMDALPEEPFTRGFIRIYSRVLGVDPEPVLAAHVEALGYEGRAHTKLVTDARRSLVRRFMVSVTLVGVLITVLALTLVLTGVTETLFGANGSQQPTTVSGNLELSEGSVFQLVSVRSTNLSITLDGRAVFSGWISKGSRHEWAPRREIMVTVEEADAIALVVDGEMRGPLGPPGGSVQRVWRVSSSEGSP